MLLTIWLGVELGQVHLSQPFSVLHYSFMSTPTDTRHVASHSAAEARVCHGSEDLVEPNPSCAHFGDLGHYIVEHALLLVDLLGGGEASQRRTQPPTVNAVHPVTLAIEARAHA